ncbi:hypothetical protein D3C80_1435400 [compost metagenome]
MMESEYVFSSVPKAINKARGGASSVSNVVSSIIAAISIIPSLFKSPSAVTGSPSTISNKRQPDGIIEVMPFEFCVFSSFIGIVTSVIVLVPNSLLLSLSLLLYKFEVLSILLLQPVKVIDNKINKIIFFII